MPEDLGKAEAIRAEHPEWGAPGESVVWDRLSLFSQLAKGQPATEGEKARLLAPLGQLEASLDSFLKGMSLAVMGQRSSAALIADDLMARSDPSAKAAGNIMRAMLAEENTEEASALLTEAVRLFEASDDRAAVNAVDFLRKIGGYDESPVPGEGHQETPWFFEPHLLRALNRAKETESPEDWQRAAEAFQKVGMNVWWALIRANETESPEDWQRAAEAFQKAGWLDQAADAWLTAARYYATLDRADPAVGCFSSALDCAERLVLLAIDDTTALATQRELRPRLSEVIRILAGLKPPVRSEVQDLIYRAVVLAKGYSLLLVIRAMAHAQGGREGHASELSGRNLHSRLTRREPDSCGPIGELQIRGRDICARLEPGVLGVEYLVAGDVLRTLTFTSDGMKVISSPWEDQFELELLRHRPAASLRNRLDWLLYAKLLSGLYRILIEPLEPMLANARRVVFAPGAELAAIPFSALSPDPRSVPCLIERLPVSHLLSLAQLPALSITRPVQGDRVLTIRGSDDAASDSRLVYAGAELAAVRSVCRGANLRVLPDGSSSLRGGSFDAEILHYAGHARFDHDDPMQGSLYLEDGPLSAAALLQTDLSRVKMTVLSACETGRSGESGSGEHLGLLRSVFARGCQSALCSMWRLDDRGAARFMSTFYGAWLGGLPASSALRAASLEEKKNQANPGTWVNFAYFGCD